MELYKANKNGTSETEGGKKGKKWVAHDQRPSTSHVLGDNATVADWARRSRRDRIIPLGRTPDRLVFVDSGDANFTLEPLHNLDLSHVLLQPTILSSLSQGSLFKNSASFSRPLTTSVMSRGAEPYSFNTEAQHKSNARLAGGRSASQSVRTCPLLLPTILSINHTLIAYSLLASRRLVA